MSRYALDLDVLRHALSGRSLSQVGSSLFETRLTEAIELGALTLTPKGALSAHVFNAADDRDDDAVFGKSPGSHIPHETEKAWIKYALSVRTDGNAGFAALETSGSKEIELSDYRIHAATDGAWDAVRDDLAEPRTILDLDHVRRLKPGEALTIESGGTLSASVSFSWAGVFASRLTDIVRELPSPVPVVVRLKTGLSAAATVRVRDRFSVVISRAADGLFRLAVKKSVSRDHELAIDVTFGAADVNAVPGIEEALAAAFEAVTGVSIDSPEASVFAGLRDELHKRLARAARWKAAAGFGWEYARIDEHEAIVDFVLEDETLLAHDHALVLSGNLAALAYALRRDSGTRRLLTYLNETTVTRRSASGFSLSLGRWLDVKARDESSFRQTTRTSLDGFRLVTSRGTRSYEEKLLPQNDYQWVVDLKAQMSEFAASPSTADFDYGLHMLVLLERRVLSEDDLARMLDLAALWDVCPPEPSMLADAIGRKTTLRLQLIFDHDDLAATLRSMDGEAGEDWAAPLAAALPYLSNFPERRSFQARRDLYTPAWKAWLEHRDYALRPFIRSGLILFEERKLPGSFAWCAGDGHPQLRERLAAFMQGASELRNCMSSEQPPDAIGRAYDHLSQLWSQRLYLVASGRYLLDRATAAGVEVNRSLQIEYAEQTAVL